jgi:hypothetical protein
MKLSLHVLYALAALTTVSAAAALGSEQGFQTVRPGGDVTCRADLPDPSCESGGHGRRPEQ